MKRAARLGDPVDHEGKTRGALVTGASSVMIEGRHAVRSCVDLALCLDHSSPLPRSVIEGSATVQFEGYPAARRGDKGACGLVIAEGAATVFVGARAETCECVLLWQKYQSEALALIQPYDEDPRARNRAISAAYARLYLNDRRMVWAGLAAYASKQVGCAMDHAVKARGIGGGLMMLGTPLSLGVGVYGAGAAGAADYTLDMLSKGNRELFLDIYPLHRFFQENGAAKMKACALTRSPPLYSEAIAGFEAIERGDLTESLAQIALHEQLNVLQPLIYDDLVFQGILVANETGAPLTSPAKLVFSSRCEGSPETVFSKGFFGGSDQGMIPELYDPDERMNWILRDAAPIYEDIRGSDKHLEDLAEIVEAAP